MREFKFDLQRFDVELYGVYVPDWVVAPSEYVTFNFDYGPVTFEDYRNFTANHHLTGRSITNRYKYENPEVLTIGYDFEWAPGYDNYYYDSSGKCYVVGFSTWLKKEEITLSGDHRIVRLADQSENNLVPHFGNSAKYVQIYGTGTDDKIGNSGSYTKIYGGGGNDTISNSGDKVTITTGTGDDFIRNDDSDSEVYASEGKNTVIGGGVISTGTDDDSIHCNLDGIIHAGDGNNTVEVVNGSTRKVAVKVTTGSGNDCITCYFADVQAGDGQNVITSLGRSTIRCGKGDDKVNISGSENLIYTGNGNDIVNVYGYMNSTIYTGGDDDEVTLECDGVFIDTGSYDGLSDNDKVLVSSFNSTVKTGTGNDHVSLGSDKSLPYKNDIDTGDYDGVNDDDEIVIKSGTENTVKTGKGNDLITVEGGSNNVINAGEGQDRITIKGGAGSKIFTGETEWSNGAPWEGDDDYVLIQSAGNNTVNTGYGGDDTVWNTGGDYVTIITGIGDDSIRNEASRVSIETGLGKDTVKNFANFVTITSGIESYDGTTTKYITNYADSVTINAGGNIDEIKNSGNGVSINAGAGDDIINLYAYTPTEDLINAGINPLKPLAQDGISAVLGFDVFEIMDIIETMGDETKTPAQRKAALEKFSEDYSEKIRENMTDKLLEGNATYAMFNNVKSKFDKINTAFTLLKDLDEAIYTYEHDKTFRLAAKDLLSDFEKDENGRWTFAWKKDIKLTTVCGGTGDDEIHSDGYTFHVYEYTEGDGNDVFYNWNINDTLRIFADSYTTDRINNDFLIHVGEDTITFKNYYSRKILRPNRPDGRLEFWPVEIELHSKDSGYTKPETPTPPITTPPGISVDKNTLTTENDFSGTIDALQGYSQNVTKIETSNSKNVEIFSSGSVRNIAGGKGHDTVYNFVRSSKINTAEGNDLVQNFNDRVTLNTGAGNDLIVNVGDSLKIDMGKGDDSAFSNGTNNIFYYNDDDGNDLIQGFNETSTLQIGDGTGTYLRQTNGADIIITAGNGSITLAGAANLSKINILGEEISIDSLLITLTEDTDTYNNLRAGATINALGGDDTVNNGGVWDDSWHNGFSNVRINAGDGNDSINNGGANVSIVGGKGNDTVNNWGVNATINGGTDDDFINNLYHPNMVYIYGGGNDTINGAVWGNGTVVIEGYNRKTTQNVDGTFLITVLNENGDSVGSITITDYYGKTFNIVSSKDAVDTINNISNDDENKTVTGTTDKDYILNTAPNVSINADNGDDKIFNYDPDVTINGGAGNDSIQNWGGICKNVKIDGNIGNDLIENWGESISVAGGAGNDTLYNNGGNNVTLDGGADNDSISNVFGNGENVLILGGSGNDTLENSWANNVTIKGGAGDDQITNWGNNVTINAGAGNDTISLRSDIANNVIEYTEGDGNDQILGLREGYGYNTILRIGNGAGTYSSTRSGSDIIVTVGEGKITLEGAANFSGVNINGIYKNPQLVTGTNGADNISNTVKGATINALGGDDTIYNGAVNVTINAGAGDDSIGNHGGYENANDLIDAGDGNDTIDNHVHDVTLRGGAGNDSIYTGDRATIEGGAGDDTIISETYNGDDFTINGGVGNDVISLHSSAGNGLIVYNNGDGDDTIGGFNENDTLQINDSYSTAVSGSNLIVSVGEGKITLDGAANLSKVNIVSSSADSVSGENISNSTSNTIVTGTADNDTIFNMAKNVTINAGAGDDSIGNHGGYQGADDLIDAGDGNDTIDNHVHDVTLRGGKGNDYIVTGDRALVEGGEGNDTLFADVNNGDSITLKGGAGDDSIRLSDFDFGHLIQYNSGDGDDTISGFNVNSTLQIIGGSYSTAVSGSDIIVTIGEGKITLDGAANLSKVNIEVVNPLLITGTDDADRITNTVEGATINALGGDDSIYSDVSNVTIDAGAGNNFIKVDSWTAENISITTGDGDDTVFNISKNSTINTGAGNDSVANASNAMVDLGDGDDYIENNNGDNVTITAGKGNDEIRNNNGNANVLFKYSEGDGDDTISGFNANTTLEIGGGSGTYSTVASGSDIIVTVDNGKITLEGAANLSTLNISGTYKNPLLIEDTDDAESINNTLDGATINALGGNDTITNSGTSVSIVGGLGNDSISNNAESNVTINTAQGNDTIKLGVAVKSFTVEDFSAGDVIELATAASTLEAITGGIKAGSVSISGVADIATVKNSWAGNVYKEETIAGAKLDGNKIIYDTADSKNLFTLTNAIINDAITVDTAKKTVTLTVDNLDKKNVTVDGDYTLALSGVFAPSQTKAEGFDGSTYKTAIISEGYTASGNTITYSAASGGATLFTLSGVKNTTGVTVDTAKKTVTLTASNLNKENVTVDRDYTLALNGVSAPTQTKAAGFDGTSYKTATISEGYTASGNTITYKAASGGATLFNLSGVKDTSGVTVDTAKKTVTLTASNLDKKNVTVDGEYTLSLSGVAAPAQTKAEGFDGTSYKTATISEGYTASGNTITYKAASGGATLFTLSGVKNTTGITVDTTKKTVTLTAANLDKKNVTVDGDYTLVLSGVSAPSQTKAEGFDGTTYKTATIGEGYTASGNTITYKAASGGATLFTLSGIKNTTGVKVDTAKKIVTLTVDNLDKKDVTVDGDYTLALSGVFASSQTKAEGFDGSTYKTATISEGYTASGNTITYKAASDGATLFTLSGVKNTTGVAVDTAKKIVTLTAANLDKKNVTVDGEYTLSLSGVVAPAQTKAEGFDGTSYKTATISEGYTASGNTITYKAASGGATLFNLSGVKNTTGITVDTTKKTVTLTAANLDKKNVTVDGDYTLVLSGVSAPSQTKAAGFDGTTYKTATIGEGYTASGNSITYKAASGGDKVFTLSGVKNTTGVAVDTAKKTVTLTTANLDKKNVTVDRDYTLALSGVAAPTQTKAAGFDGSTYKTATIGEGYTASGNSITYKAASDGATLFTLTGVKNTSGVTVDTAKKTVTLTASNLDKKNVTVDGDYTLKLASDVDTTKEDISKWTTLKSGNVAYLAGGKGSYYSASGGKVTYKASVAGASKFELSGAKGTPTLSGNTVKLTASNFKSNVSVASNAGGYKVSLNGDFKGKTFNATAGKDSIASSGKKITIAAGKGNDKVTLGSGSVFFYAKGDGNDTLYNFSSTDKIKLSGTSKATPTISGKDVVFTTDGGKITVKNAAQGTAVKVVNSKDKVISNYTYTTSGIADGKSITLNSNFSGTFDAKAYTKVDGSKVSKSIKIIGGSGNDTLSGGAGNDTLTGGKGKDLFVFGGGKDVITDYTSDDKISVDKTLGTGTYKVSGKNVVLTYGNNSLTVKNGLNKKITFDDGASGTYTKSGIFNSKKTAVTLPAATKTFKATSYSKLVTVDGSAATSTINITGNKLANYIIAGNNGSTIDGGSGNDILKGGTGKDSLIGGNGNDSLAGGKGADILRGGKGNDTLWGGAGNDSLYGGSGNDVFIYKAGEGTDKIFDYSAGDMLQILKSNGKAGSFTKSKYSGGTLSLTIKGGGSVVFDGVAKGDTFNINNKTYKISGSKLK